MPPFCEMNSSHVAKSLLGERKDESYRRMGPLSRPLIRSGHLIRSGQWSQTTSGISQPADRLRERSAAPNKNVSIRGCSFSAYSVVIQIGTNPMVVFQLSRYPFFCLPFFCQPGRQAKRWEAEKFRGSCRGRILAIRP